MSTLEEQNRPAIHELISALNGRQSVLMAGAGCSVGLGYPDWWTLVNEMRRELAPELVFPSGIDVKLAAARVKQESYKLYKRQDPYERYIGDKFRPRTPACQDFHCDLVKLGFAGVVTTNYDVVMEAAINRAFVENSPCCQPVNLCNRESRYKVTEYLRDLGHNSPPSSVLHLHGCYDRPSEIVLSQDDYEFFYNGIPRESEGALRGQPRAPDTLHRKTIWALLATRSVAFAGFSLEDSFFVDVISVWRQDFDLCLESPHFAIMGAKSEEERHSIREKLCMLGVKPIFYEIPEDNPQNHSGLHRLVAEVAERLGVRTTEPDVNIITRRTLGLL
jgi:hypothetical protein